MSISTVCLLPVLAYEVAGPAGLAVGALGLAILVLCVAGAKT
jgi:hypothetical protein